MLLMLLLAILGVCLQLVFIKVEHEEKYVPAVILKGSASLCFVLLGFVTAQVSQDASFTHMVKLGLIFGAGGDILLNLRFVFPKIGQKIFLLGIAVFLTGHIMYLCALIPKANGLWICIACGAVATALLLTWIFKHITAKPAFKIFGVFYIGAIVVMTSVAIGVLLGNPSSVCSLLFVIGALSFTVSDIILILNTFGHKQTFRNRIMNLLFYYAGQLLIAFCLLAA